MKKFMLTLAMGTALMASPALAQEKLKIGATVYGLNAEFMQIWTSALQQHPAVKNGEVDITIFDGRYDALVQQEQVNTMITQQYDAILIVPLDVEAAAAPVQAAVDAGIPVVGSNARVNSEALTAYVGSNDVEAGELEAKAVLDKMGCKGNVVILEGPIGQSGQIQRLEGNMKALEACPEVKVLEQQTGNWSRAEAQTLMENWLTSHAGQINGVIGQNDEMALGAIEAIKSAGLKVEDFAIAGVDGVTDAINAVKEGQMASILQDANAQAQGALDVAIKAVKKDYEPESDIWKQYPQMEWKDGTAKDYLVPWTPVTTENADKLLEARSKL
ncbi:substrate-binding domain-containing protein [Tianweitania sp. BSSL-BM11]|uniref:Substrate-binding domain-containing protein n=1 Tax=Tianweitania aestuarii TaxID=2814886 RepID=A0ABS5RRE6_9HYPH|nr:substrate-binding domain-containing protein [Tianweitania aestuarii]MBS9719623.1 substrate-binding domain-containing protein [Tianweitania aestuarii]